MGEEKDWITGADGSLINPSFVVQIMYSKESTGGVIAKLTTGEVVGVDWRLLTGRVRNMLGIDSKRCVHCDHVAGHSHSCRYASWRI